MQPFFAILEHHWSDWQSTTEDGYDVLSALDAADAGAEAGSSAGPLAPEDREPEPEVGEVAGGGSGVPSNPETALPSGYLWPSDPLELKAAVEARAEALRFFGEDHQLIQICFLT